MLHKYLDCDFYWVEIDKDGNKVVHPYGFVYDAEESVDDDGCCNCLTIWNDG